MDKEVRPQVGHEIRYQSQETWARCCLEGRGFWEGVVIAIHVRNEGTAVLHGVRVGNVIIRWCGIVNEA